jgi:biotin synthase
MKKTITKVNIDSIKEKALNKKDISFEDANYLTSIDHKTNIKELFLLFQAANEVRERFLGKRITLCSITNAKSGLCAEDCSFCGQSSRFDTKTANFKLLPFDKLKESVDNAVKSGASEFSFVTSGKKISNQKEFDTIKKAIKYTKSSTDMEVCSSLGLMSEEELLQLKGLGMDHFHHNLETARSFFPNIVTTHSYDEELEVIKSAKRVGLYTCCGGIFGMGESWSQRIELAFDLKVLKVDSIPINFLNPIERTPLEFSKLLDPFEALKIVSIYRLIFPNKNVMVMGGREKVLRDLQSWIFFAGASGMLLGNYLTTKGRSAEDDLAMIADLGLVPHKNSL